MKKALSLIFAAAVLTFGFVSCNCEDIGWTPEQPAAQLIGYVHFEDNTPVANAKIDVVVGSNTYSVTTDENGFYRIDKIATGEGRASVSYPVDPEIPGSTKLVQLKEAYVNECDFLLVRTKSTMAHEGDIYTVTLPDIIQQDKSISQIATYYMPYGTMAENDDLSLVAYYEVEPYLENVTKAGEENIHQIPEIDDEGYTYTKMDVIVTVISTSKLFKKKAEKAFKIEIKDLIHPISVMHNGVYVKYETDDENQVSYFFTDEYGTSKFRYPIYVKILYDQSEPITSFDPAEFKSSGELFTHIKSKYSRKWGKEIVWELHTPSFLWQYVKLLLGGDTYLLKHETYECDAIIPKGEILVLSGYQTYWAKDFKCEWAHVFVKHFDGFKIEGKDRKHTGGSN